MSCSDDRRVIIWQFEDLGNAQTEQIIEPENREYMQGEPHFIAGEDFSGPIPMILEEPHPTWQTPLGRVQLFRILETTEVFLPFYPPFGITRDKTIP